MGMDDADADEVFDGIAFDRLSPYRVPFVVVATMGIQDEDALLAALEREPPYLALVGSRRRFETVADLLRLQGADAERVAAIRVPAGLDIGAETPAEIALSILAEAVQVRRDLRVSGKLALLGPVEDEPPASQIVIDPICGMEVDLATARHTLEVNGETLGFCCPGCLYAYRQQLAG
jgi:xanthine dehydrogenase accessory factor